MSTPKLISRYILRQFLMSFFAVMLTLGFIILLFDVIEMMKKDAVSFVSVMTMSLLKLPNMLITILPFGVLIGGIIVFWRLTKSHELVIIRAAGESVWQFITPLLVMSFLIGVFSVTVFNPFAATMYTKFERLDDDRKGMPHISTASRDLWLREHRDGKMYTLHANGLRQEEYELILRDVSIMEFSEDNLFLKRINARKATLRDGRF